MKKLKVGNADNVRSLVLLLQLLLCHPMLSKTLQCSLHVLEREFINTSK